MIVLMALCRLSFVVHITLQLVHRHTVSNFHKQHELAKSFQGFQPIKKYFQFHSCVLYHIHYHLKPRFHNEFSKAQTWSSYSLLGDSPRIGKPHQISQRPGKFTCSIRDLQSEIRVLISKFCLDRKTRLASLLIPGSPRKNN